MYKFFNGKKYYLDKLENRWKRTTSLSEFLSRDTWIYYYPNDPILKDEIIHHINEDTSDDRIENLQKMKRNKHQSLHMTGKFLGDKNPNWCGGISEDVRHNKKLRQKYDKKDTKYCKSKNLFFICDKEDKFAYADILLYNSKTKHVTISHTWYNYNSKKN